MSVAQSRATLVFASACVALLAASLMGGTAGVPMFGALAFILPVALCGAQGRTGMMSGLLMWASVNAVLVVRGLGVPIFILTAMTGVPLGLGLARHWSYARTVTITASLLCLTRLIEPLLAWEQWKAFSLTGVDEATVRFADLVTSATDENQRVIAQALVEFFSMLRSHWQDVGVGILFGQTIILACVLVSLGSWFARRLLKQKGFHTRFRDMRPPDWLVWAAIVAALLWFVDRQWPGDWIRVVSWNTGIGLAAVYWLNGCSVLAYTVAAFQTHFWIPLLAMFLIAAYAGPMQALCAVGLFDTWAEFRVRVDRGVVALDQWIKKMKDED